MKVIKISKKSGYAVSTNKFFNFARFEKKAGNFVLIEGGFEKAKGWEQYDYTKEELSRLLKEKIVRLEFEEPNKFFVGDDPNQYEHYFYKILTICPYTANWLNKKHKYKKCIPVFYPFNEQDIPKKKTKKYDIIYAGHITAKKVYQDINVMTKFHYRFVSSKRHPLVTNLNASHKEKMDLIAQSKITLVHNILIPRLFHILNIWRIKDWEKNEALKYIPRWYEPWKLLNINNIICPQVKSRLFEAAFGRSLILCRKDPFNIVEQYFVPGKEFVYFEDGQLEDKIRDILNNYPKYEKIAENAYKKAVKNYTTEAFFNKYLKNIV